MSAQQIIVKAYYNDLVENQPEIRRFTLDVSPNNDVYQALETTISQLNGDYRQGEFTLQYVDEDNDRITFSSASELRSTLNNVTSGGVLKVYVKPKTKKSAESTSENTTVHPGVTCDGCEGPVIGIRYKCTECPDYDLCQSCWDKKVHPDHNMIKMARPWRGFFGGHRRCGRGPFAGGPFAGGPFAGGPFAGGRCGGGPRFWRHFMRQQQQQQQSGDGAAGFQMPADMTSFLSQYNGKELAELIEAHLPEYLRTEKMNEMLNQFKTGEQATKPVDQSILLEHVGKFLQEILSPFGIDCDYFVDNHQTQKPNEQQSETNKQTEETTANNNDNNTSTEPKPSAPPSTETPTASASANAPSFGNLLEQLQTAFAPMFQPPTNATTTTTTAVDQQAQEQKKIDECIERMTAMGFVDSNGILSELIKAKKGDLNQVLDALNPRNYKN